MIGILINHLVSTDCRNIFVYELNSKDAELTKYKELQGDNYIESHNGLPLYISTKYHGASMMINIKEEA